MITHSDEGAGTVRDVASALEYWPLPPPWGWTADDLDLLPPDGPGGEPGVFRHVELVDGALVFPAPQTRRHQKTIAGLLAALDAQARRTWWPCTGWTSPSDRAPGSAPTCC